MPLRIVCEVGRSYRLRNGKIVVCRYIDGKVLSYPVGVENSVGRIGLLTAEGRYYQDGHPSCYDLVEEL